MPKNDRLTSSPPETSPPDPLSLTGEGEKSSPLPGGRGAGGEVLADSRPKLTESRAPWIAGALFALPVLIARSPPMTDLALHEAVLAVLMHRTDPKFFPPELYQLNFGHPNQLFYLVAWPIAYIVGTTWAMKIIVAATQVALYASAARFARHMGTPQWTALLVGALGLGWMFYWGLLANMVGLALLLAVIPTMDAFLARPTLRGAAWSIVALIGLYFAHETMMLCACLMIGLFSLGYGVLSWAFLLRLFPAVAAFGLGLGHVIWAQRLRNAVNVMIPTTFHPFVHKIEIVPGVLFAGYEPLIRNLMFAVAMVAMVLFAVERWRTSRPVRGMSLRELYVRYRFEIFAACLFVAYIILPYTLSGSTLFYHRFFPPAYAIVAVVLAPQVSAGTGWRVPKLVASVVPLGSMLIAWPSFADSHQIAVAFDHMVDHLEYNSSCVIVDIGPKPPGRLFAQSPLEGHALARRGGRTLFDFTRSPIAPAYLNPRYAWDEPYLRMMREPIMIRPDHDLNRFRYVFFHTTYEQWGFDAEEAFGSDAKLIAHEGEWFLFESSHLKDGLLAPDVPMPWPKPKSLRKRLRDLWRRRDGIPIPPDPVVEPLPGAPRTPEDSASRDPSADR